jgi:hypothetical protein
MLQHITMHDLVFVIPMAFVGVIVMGMIPFAARTLQFGCRCVGAVVGAIVAVIVLVVIPLLI